MSHPVALTGFSTDPWRYEWGRPEYPPDALRFILATIPNGPGDLTETIPPAGDDPHVRSIR